MNEQFKVWIAPNLNLLRVRYPGTKFDLEEIPPPKEILIDYHPDIFSRAVDAIRTMRHKVQEDPICLLIGWKAYLCLDRYLMITPAHDFDPHFKKENKRFFIYGVPVICEPRWEYTVTALPPHSAIGSPEMKAVDA
jgi:hypothetical protein